MEIETLCMLDKLKKSNFRKKFYLRDKEIQYINEKGIDVIESHARDFIKNRLAPDIIPNDGKQTPMRGHPVFIAQHATATCCRNCLYKWYGIPKQVKLTYNQQEYIVNIIISWIVNEMKSLN